MRIVEATNRQAVRELLSPQRVRDIETDRRVAAIVADVREHGDDALLRYARTFDGLEGEAEISRQEMTAAARTVPAPVRRAIRSAANNIRTVANSASCRSIAWVVMFRAAGTRFPRHC